MKLAGIDSVKIDAGSDLLAHRIGRVPGDVVGACILAAGDQLLYQVAAYIVDGNVHMLRIGQGVSDAGRGIERVGIILAERKLCRQFDRFRVQVFFIQPLFQFTQELQPGLVFDEKAVSEIAQHITLFTLQALRGFAGEL